MRALDAFRMIVRYRCTSCGLGEHIIQSVESVTDGRDAHRRPIAEAVVRLTESRPSLSDSNRRHSGSGAALNLERLDD